MNRLLTASLLGLFLGAVQAAAFASTADDAAVPAKARTRTTKKVYTPAWSSGKTSAPAEWRASDPEAYQRELDAAKEQRDKDLEEAAKETDRAKFEKRKSEIFAKHTAIIAKLREQYLAANPQAEPAAPPAPKWSATKKQPAKANAKAKPAPKTDTAAIASAQAKLNAENDRHAAAMKDLTKQLDGAKASGDRREVRRVEKAIEKEKVAYASKKASLERQIRQAGGTLNGGTPTWTARS